MKSIRCFFNIHKYKNVDGRGIAADEDDHVCDFCWNKFGVWYGKRNFRKISSMDL